MRGREEEDGNRNQPDKENHSPDEVIAVGTERRLSKVRCHELVSIHNVDFSPHCSSVSSQHLTPCYKLMSRTCTQNATTNSLHTNKQTNKQHYKYVNMVSLYSTE